MIPSELLLATTNVHKTEELRTILPDMMISDLNDVGWDQEIIEDGSTFHANASIKATVLFEHFEKPILAEDSGLCVDLLDGAPGIRSARYAGDNADAQANMDKLLRELRHTANRDAFYISVLCYIDDKGREHFFEGRCPGAIAYHRSGQGGFGYDPIFIPKGYVLTFGELPSEVKNSISHRKMATEKFIEFLSR